ncbi:hypothetical protein PROFUN_02858 [Planoprotostelium fungivorum]|uniref:R3H-associated N-terminal domain-containing protein n=1 Tax=Planoprotostelium fungivorum TaxID=1890364 RepID=A0A2P6NRW3_9EUKA|nr:hypothetical protein PROFUN_02858 [Planoprotostelium fungivorum]
MAQFMTAGGVTYTHLMAPATAANPTTTPNGRRRKFGSPMPRANNVGLPGSRRYRRWLNKSYLMEQEGELEIEDFVLFHQSHQPVFTTKCQAWDQFVNTTEEHQGEMLKSMGAEFSQNVQQHHGDRWSMMDNRLKRLLISSFGSDALLSIDTQVRNFLEASEVSMDLVSEDTYGRLLCTMDYGLQRAQQTDRRSWWPTGEREKGHIHCYHSCSHKWREGNAGANDESLRGCMATDSLQRFAVDNVTYLRIWYYSCQERSPMALFEKIIKLMS